MRRWLWIPAAVLLALLSGLALGWRSWAESVLVARAGEQGVLLEFEGLALDYPELRLEQARLRLAGFPGVEAKLRQVRVRLALGGGRPVESIVGEGGELTLSGSVEQLKAALEAWSGRSRRGAARTGRPRRGADLALRELDVTWTGALAGSPPLRVVGLAAEQTSSVRRLSAARVELARAPLEVKLLGLRAEWKRAEPRASFERLELAELRLTLDAGEDAPTPPGAQPASAAAGAPPGLGERLRVEPARVAALRALLALLREEVLPELPRRAVVERTYLDLAEEGRKLSVGPSRLELTRADSGLEVDFVPGREARGTPLELALRLPVSESEPVRAELRGGPVSLAALGVEEGAFGLSRVAEATLAGSADVTLSPDARSLSGTGELTFEQLALSVERLAPGTLRFPRLTLRAEGSVAVDGSRIELQAARLGLGDARFEAALRAERVEQRVLVDARLEAPLVSCQALADSAPRGLLGAAEALRWAGTFSLEARVRADSSALGDMQVHWDFENACKVSAAPPELDPARFRSAFFRDVVGAGGAPLRVESGPATASWVPLAELSPYVESALLVTEDGRFYRHDGFDDRAIESAIRANTSAGRFVRGASTLSMQLAKNLYLTREKTLARKLQEAALTVLLEQSFEKRELLELYVNSVEFGPGVYGIGPAAEYYFRTEASQLGAAQAFFLASILPAPTRQYFGADGRLSPARAALVRRLLEIAKQRKLLGDHELAVALASELVFGQPVSSAPPSGAGAADAPTPPPGAAP